jgi:hypothetical protein
MEATSLLPDLHAARSRHPNNGGARQGVQVLEADVLIPPLLPSPREDHILEVVQQPEIAKVAAPREKGESLSPSFALLPSTKHRFLPSANAT